MPEQAAELREVAKNKGVLLLHAARDEKHNNAVALKEFLEMHPVEQKPYP
jgi:uncharacterized protein YeaO (DUF488 family)